MDDGDPGTAKADLGGGMDDGDPGTAKADPPPSAKNDKSNGGGKGDGGDKRTATAKATPLIRARVVDEGRAGVRNLLKIQDALTWREGRFVKLVRESGVASVRRANGS
jgi:hypothetical protein